MICPFCSLLCDDASQLASCSRRANALDFASRTFRVRSVHDVDSSRVQLAKQWLSVADKILVSGRIHSIETARAAIEFAKQHRATLDGSENGATMDVALAMSKTGTFGVSLAEARELSDFVVVLGDDRLMQEFPLLPNALQSDLASTTVLLLGQFSAETKRTWQKSFSNVWQVNSDVQTLPEALQHWLFMKQSNEPFEEESPALTRSLFDAWKSAQYVSIVWSASTLVVDERELWVERLLETVLNSNESRRVGALGLSGQDCALALACSWTTGFPGRISFQSGNPEYMPNEASWSQWLDRNAQNSNALWVSIDEGIPTQSSIGFQPIVFHGKRIHLSTQHHESDSRTIWMPIPISGHDIAANMVRADQVVLAKVDPGIPAGVTLRTATEWLESFKR